MSQTIGQIKQNNQQLNNLSQIDRNSLKPEERDITSMPISDTDYEFLFDQLLEGIAHGWHDRRIVKFFVGLGDRANQKDWVAWLERLRGKALALPPPSKRQLGKMMIRLGELTRSTTEVNQIGAVSHRIGKELLFGNVESVWEYVGPDSSPPDNYNATRNLEDLSKQELSERLPTNFKAFSSHRDIEKTEESSELDESTKIELDFDLVEEPDLLNSTTEPSEPDTVGELVEQFDWEDLSENEISDPFADLELNYTNEQKYSRKLDLPTPESAIVDELEADLVDFPESISEAKQTTPEIFSSEAESSMSSKQQQKLSPTLIPEEGDRDNLHNAPLLHTPELEAFDIDRVMNLIQEDEELARQISQKLNLEIAKTENTSLDRSSLELIESWFNLGLKQVSAGELTKAIASWEKALSINPNLSEAWHNRGSALGRLGEYQAAIESFQNALAIDPNNYQAWNDRAHALYQLQNWTEAADSWSNAIKIMPGNHLFWYNRACALEQLEKWDEAIASHEKALEIVPDFQPGRSRYINLIADSSRSN